MVYLRWILLFVPLLAFFFHILLVFESQCSAQTVSLFTRLNDIVLAGESISLRCSVSDTKPEDDIIMEITNQTGQQITSGSAGLDDATVYTELTTPFEISTNQTFFCSVTWVDFTASTNLTISPLPIEQTYCTSNYTDGIIVGQTVTLTCYSSTSGVGFISWSSDSDITFDETIGLVRTMTQYNRINVKPSVSRNGSVFTCECDGVAPVTDIDRCTVGPIYVYEKLDIFIDPITTTTDPAILYPGQANNYTCSSLPTSSVQWSIPKKLDDSGIEFSVVGSMITVRATTNTTFIGDVRLVCSGQILDQTAAANITLAIIPLELPTTPASNTVSSKPPGNQFPVVSLIPVIGFLLFALSIILVLLYRKRRHTDSELNSKSIANVTSSVNVAYDYCDINTDSVARTVTSRVIIYENVTVAYEIPDARSTRTIIDEEENESVYYNNLQKFNFGTYGQKRE
ncbi:uncharacterized protein [Apostichopus japonicus]|uniref:uncharacterized protein n=1 Tax=Stichopus japonicus TaxID=307972 RepID=UPI003AB1F78B